MALRDRLGGVGPRLASAVHRRVTIDIRSLAAFRVALGLLVLADLLRRARNLRAFYTDAGVLPRAALLSSDPLHLSLHALSGEAWFQAALFVVAGAFAVALTVGYCTRAATVGTWLLLVSLHNRMGLVLNGGDVLLRLLLFWAMFLPLAERWSVDAERNDGRQMQVTSAATAALLVQVVLVYAVNAVFKLSGDVWLRGDGLEYVFSLGQFTVLLGDHLAAYPAVLRVLDYLWLGMVAGSFLLVVLAGWWRTGFVSLFVALHVGMLLTMRLDLFPLISVASLIPFLPASFWNAVLPRLSRHLPTAAVGRCPGWLAGRLPTVTVTNVPPLLRRSKERLLTVVPPVFLVLVLLWNVQYLGHGEVYGRDALPDAAESAIEFTRTDQYWDMFAPDPLSTDGWVVAPGRLEDGTRVDAFHGGGVRWDRPPDVSSTYPTARWRKYLVRLWRHDTADRERFAAYLCREWNRGHESELVNVSVYFFEQPTRLGDEPEPTRRVELATHRC